MIINQNILEILRTFLNLQKNSWKPLHQHKKPPEVFYKKSVLKTFYLKIPVTCAKVSF